ncbi:PilW family protein [Corticibacter populi]|nr:prepilin-type N-terminal cleavage/methylation domain-containing protein [Corticibacter populi]
MARKLRIQEVMSVHSNSARCSESHGQRGISLVELMVSMAIGLFIILAVTQIFINTGGHYRFRQGQSENLITGRYTLEMLEAQMAKAGYRRDPSQDTAEAFPAAAGYANGCAFDVREAIATADHGLCIRYQPYDAQEVDFAGKYYNGGSMAPSALGAYTAADPSTVMFVERYYVDEATQELRWVPKNVALASGTVLADGVRSIHFEFGVGPASDSEAQRSIQEFTTAPEANESIRALRYTVLLESPTGRVSVGMESSACDQWTEAGGDEELCSDNSAGKLLQLASGAVMLRNLMP